MRRVDAWAAFNVQPVAGPAYAVVASFSSVGVHSTQIRVDLPAGITASQVATDASELASLSKLDGCALDGFPPGDRSRFARLLELGDFRSYAADASRDPFSNAQRWGILRPWEPQRLTATITPFPDY